MVSNLSRYLRMNSSTNVGTDESLDLIDVVVRHPMFGPKAVRYFSGVIYTLV
jgi:hypothetical protein